MLLTFIGLYSSNLISEILLADRWMEAVKIIVS